MADPRSYNHTTHRGANNRRWLAIGVLAVLGVIFLSLANWQLNRAEQRRQIAAQIEAGRAAPPVRISPTTDFEALAPWQSIDAEGKWLSQWSVLLDNRNLDGKPGLWLASLFEYAPKRALLVVRGWIPRPIGQYNRLPDITEPTQTILIQGEAASHVPRLYDLSDESSFIPRQATVSPTPKGLALDLSTLARAQNISVDQMASASGLAVAPVVLLQTGGPEDAHSTQFIRRWPQPSIDADKNVGYAMQWTGFALIAFTAMGVLLWRNRRHAKIRQ